MNVLLMNIFVRQMLVRGMYQKVQIFELTTFLWSIFAPCLMSFSTTGLCPFLAATIRAVLFSCSVTARSAVSDAVVLTC